MNENTYTPAEGDRHIDALAWHLMWSVIDSSQADTQALMQSLQPDAGIDPLSPSLIPLDTVQQVLLRLGASSRDLLGHIPAIVCRLAPDGTMLFVNDTVLNITGYQPEELQGRNWWDVFFPCGQRHEVDDLYLQLSSGDVADYEMVLMAKDGSLKTVSWSFWNRLRPDGTLDSIIAFGLDITERRQVERRAELSQEQITRAKASQEETATILEGIQDAFFALDRQGRFTYLNREAERLLRRKREDIIGKNLWAEFPASVDASFFERYQEAMSGQVPTDFEAFYPPYDIWVEVHAYPSKNGLSVRFHDVTERKRAEKALRESEELYRRIVETAQEGIWIIDAEDKTAFVNQKMAEMLGYTVEEMIGVPLFSFVDEECRRTAAADMERHSSGTTEQHDLKFYRKDGSDLWTIISTSPLFDNEGRCVGTLVMVTDVTAHKRADDASRDSEERYRALAEAAQDIIFVVNCDDHVEYVNSSAAKHFRLTPEDIIGKPRGELFPPDVSAAQKRRLQEVFETGKPLYGEDKIIFPGGDAWLGTQLVPIFGREGKVRAALGISRDMTERKRMEEALRESEERFRGAFEYAAIGKALVAPDGRFLMVNRFLCEIVGYSEQELLATTFQAITYLDDLQTDLEQVRRMLAGEIRTYQMEKRYIHKLGHEVWVLLSVSLVCDALGKPLYFVAEIQDITERKRAEEMLRDSERKYRELVDSLPETIFEADERGRIVFGNRNAFKTFGYTEEEFEAGLNISQMLAPEDRRRGREMVQRVLGGEDHGGIEYELLRKDGSTFPCIVHSSPIERQRHVVGLRGVIVDITERKRFEGERERLLVREQALAQLGRALVSELDLDRVADVVMKQSMKVLGVDAVALWLANPSRRELNLLAHCNLDNAAAIIHQMLYDATSATARAAETEQIQAVEDVFADGNPQTVTYQIAIRTGMRSLLAVPLLAWGRLVGVVTYCCRSQRIFSQDDLEINATVAGLFAMAIANARLHQDLRNRERQVSLLLKATFDAQEDERQRICLEIHDGIAQILTSASHHLEALDSHPDLPDGLSDHVHNAATLVRDALHEARDMIANLRPATLDALGLLETLRSELADIQARTALQIDFYADRIRFSKEVETGLYRIIREAVNNVVKHAHARSVSVLVKEEGGIAIISIQDDGIGFNISVLEHQAYPRGVGLLSMRKRAEWLGGSFTIESSPGKGTRVSVELPLLILGDERDVFVVADHQVSFASTADTWSNLDPITVLIVDDHALTREGLRAMLETNESVQVIGEACDGLEALSAVAELRPRIVLMDIRMPNLDGLEATRQIKSKYPTTAVIVMTHYEDDSLVVDAVQAGAAGYLLKDVTRELLDHTIGAVASGGILIKAPLLRRALSNLMQTKELNEGGHGKPPNVQRLSEREQEVLKLLAEGWTNKEIGNALVITEVTVKKHVQSIIAKLGASDRTHAAILAIRSGLII